MQCAPPVGTCPLVFVTFAVQREASVVLIREAPVQALAQITAVMTYIYHVIQYYNGNSSKLS